MNSFQNRLVEAIRLRGISKAELARRTGIGRNSISDYTNGKYEAKQDYLYLLAKELKVNEAWLMGLDVPMEKTLSILEVYEKLPTEYQNIVLNFATQQLTLFKQGLPPATETYLSNEDCELLSQINSLSKENKEFIVNAVKSHSSIKEDVDSNKTSGQARHA